ncbi:MAG: hypothetical protein HKO05_09550 [Erythrobacter sp.]|nr:hypothetical protein [Erythrobacter sp.]NND20297.1 hypothetical protein [Silicimonas sp.]NNL73420.1 hypothetical protein [Silicimonas sp.]
MNVSVIAWSVAAAVVFGLCGAWAWRVWRNAKLVARTVDRIAPALLEPESFFELVSLSRRRSHFLERHGPMLKLDEIQDRALSGNIPAAGLSGKPVSSARWFRHKDLLAAVNSAREHWMNGARPRNGVFRFRFDEAIGEGYQRNSTMAIKTDRAIVVIKGETVVTAYPVIDGSKERGWHDDTLSEIVAK